jgi:hypothetical protein
MTIDAKDFAKEIQLRAKYGKEEKEKRDAEARKLLEKQKEEMRAKARARGDQLFLEQKPLIQQAATDGLTSHSFLVAHYVDEHDEYSSIVIQQLMSHYTGFKCTIEKSYGSPADDMPPAYSYSLVVRWD